MNDRFLRILVILPMYGGSLPIGRYCCTALREIGHTVRCFESPAMYPAFTGLKELQLPPENILKIENSFIHIVSQAILAHVESFEPHLVLAMAQAPVDKNILLRIKNSGIRTAMWFVEDYSIFNYWKLYAPLYDIFAVIQKEPFITELRKIGQENSLYLPLAADPSFHKPIHLTNDEQREYGADIAFLGAGYPNRRLAFRHLAGRNFKIWGSDWEGESLLSKNIQRNGQRISSEDSVRIYNATKININLHSSVHTEQLVSHGDFVNPRTFELAAMKAFQLVDERSLMGELFGSDELVTFGDMEDCCRKIDFFLSHPVEREQYREKAFVRVLKEHTYVHRMRTLVSSIESSVGWGMPIGVETHQDPNSYQDELSHVMESFLLETGLGPHSSLETAVSSLKARKGPLSEAETAVLFLDAWKRQYLHNDKRSSR